MTKEQAIQNAYGEYWEMIKDYANEQGWINCKAIFPSSGFTYEIGFSEKGNYWRPIALEGIETNNKWIKIESEDELPKEDYVYWVMRKELTVPLYRQVELWGDEEKEYWMKNFSHYQPIIKPKPPIY